MKIWHVNLNEKESNPFNSSGVFESLVVLGEQFDEVKEKVENYMEEPWSKLKTSDGKSRRLFIGKIEFVEDINIE